GVKVYAGCKIGDRCILHSGVVVGGDGFGFAPNKAGEYDKLPQTGIVVIEDDVEIGANTTVDRATFGCTRIGKGTKLDNLIMVAHNVEIGKNNVFAAQSGVAGSTKIGDCNMVGGQVGFAGHISVGSHNQIGAQSGIPGNVGDCQRLMGYPAVDVRKFARNAVYINRLQELFDELKRKK
ncbi:MAG: UDP-3-O-(3-hydroxymyristoyl)glucosamine N-acyltransferase, partial [Muribaculaceae bacterium]|nr:UDP-3-O-(3-hydroxymyristoyl)glucosamine N-acyltransferase [Muribaculaceae bacterium]